MTTVNHDGSKLRMRFFLQIVLGYNYSVLICPTYQCHPVTQDSTFGRDMVVVLKCCLSPHVLTIRRPSTMMYEVAPP